MKLLFLGDVVGQVGREAVQKNLPLLKQKYHPDAIIINGENAASGRGITQKIARQFYELGVGAITMGNHTFDNKEIFDFIDEDSKIVRPANYAEEVPGKGYTYIKTSSGEELAVINLQGRTFLPPVECPFKKASMLVETIRKRTPYIFVDFHAEATSEKQSLAWYLDGKVSAVVGTHTHVQTADERILPGGTAYITDAGMCGPRNSVLGMDKEAVIKKFLTGMPVRFEVANSAPQINGVLITLQKRTGRALGIQRILIDDDHLFME